MSLRKYRTCQVINQSLTMKWIVTFERLSSSFRGRSLRCTRRELLIIYVRCSLATRRSNVGLSSRRSKMIRQLWASRATSAWPISFNTTKTLWRNKTKRNVGHRSLTRRSSDTSLPSSFNACSAKVLWGHKLSADTSKKASKNSWKSWSTSFRSSVKTNGSSHYLNGFKRHLWDKVALRI